MIVTCTCGIKLKVNDDKITDTGVKIRCPKCGTVHTVRKLAQSVPTPAVPPPTAGGTLVIIAHDSKFVADMIDGVLKEAGMASEFAPNGLEALKKATDLKPQAMIVDVGLTGIYGFELCERLKGAPETRDIKIILLSSVYGLTAYKRAPVTLYGADDYIEKHHISDQLVPKLKRLVFGEAAAPPLQAPPQALREEPPQTQPQAFEPVSLSVLQAQPAQSHERIPQKTVSEPVVEERPAMPEIPSILPTTPVTLGTTRKAEQPFSRSSAAAAPPATPEGKPVAPVKSASQPGDASVKLDAGFFEQEEYPAPVAAEKKQAADPEEIEKARRFARIIVSDIALYNQEAVHEGIANNTFYDVLRDDIEEGRQLYDGRVPANIRETKDYLQEAFDDFIASQKKLR